MEPNLRVFPDRGKTSPTPGFSCLCEGGENMRKRRRISSEGSSYPVDIAMFNFNFRGRNIRRNRARCHHITPSCPWSVLPPSPYVNLQPRLTRGPDGPASNPCGSREPGDECICERGRVQITGQRQRTRTIVTHALTLKLKYNPAQSICEPTKIFKHLNEKLI